MRKSLCFLLGIVFCLLVPMRVLALAVNEVGGWMESAYVTWTPMDGAVTYRVMVRPLGGEYVQLDAPLVRDYGTYGRADA